MKRRSTDSTTTLAHVTPIHYSTASSPKIIVSEPPHRHPNKKKKLADGPSPPQIPFQGKVMEEDPTKDYNKNECQTSHFSSTSTSPSLHSQ